MNPPQQAFEILNASLARAQKLEKTPDTAMGSQLMMLVHESKRIKGELGLLAPVLGGHLLRGEWVYAKVIQKLQNPEIALVWESSVDQALRSVFRQSTYEQSLLMGAFDDWVTELETELPGFLGVWSMDDGSAFVSFYGYEQMEGLLALLRYKTVDLVPVMCAYLAGWRAKCTMSAEELVNRMQLREQSQVAQSLELGLPPPATLFELVDGGELEAAGRQGSLSGYLVNWVSLLGPAWKRWEAASESERMEFAQKLTAQQLWSLHWMEQSVGLGVLTSAGQHGSVSGPGYGIRNKVIEEMSQSLLWGFLLGHKLVALSAEQMQVLKESLAHPSLLSTEEPLEWKRGLTVKNQRTGALVHSYELSEWFERVASQGKDLPRRSAQRRLDILKALREQKLKQHWRQTVCEHMIKVDVAPVYDAGVAAFLMSKANLFGQYPKSYWERILGDLTALLRPLTEGEPPVLDDVVRVSSHLGADISTQMGHFLYRYFRSGGAKLLAKRVMEQTRDRLMADEAKTGLAALITRKEEPVSEEVREATRSAGSVEFAVQYGSALALYSSLWGLETAFQNPKLQARVFVKAMRGANEISLECLGWFAKLMHVFSEGFLSPQEIESFLMFEIEAATAAHEDMKRRGGKISIENEWSGSWGTSLARRKVREYLDLPLDDQRTGAEAIAAATAALEAAKAKSLAANASGNSTRTTKPGASGHMGPGQISSGKE